MSLFCLSQAAVLIRDQFQLVIVDEHTDVLCIETSSICQGIQD